MEPSEPTGFERVSLADAARELGISYQAMQRLTWTVGRFYKLSPARHPRHGMSISRAGFNRLKKARHVPVQSIAPADRDWLRPYEEKEQHSE